MSDEIRNGSVFAPPLETSVAEFRSAIVEACAAGCRVVALFGEGRAPEVGLVAVLADDQAGLLHVLRARSEDPVYPALTPELSEVHLFEREIHERNHLVPEGHPWLAPVRYIRPDQTVGVADFHRVEGESVHEVAVGPVHAGVIEPGHFRFQCHGERVFQLEIALGYQHRGVENALVGGRRQRVIHLAETLAGDTTIAHVTAHCEAVEALSNTAVPARARAIRAVALELERLANHVGDLGALAGDVAFLPTASYCGRLRGDFLNLTAALCGNRFGRSLVIPGGVSFDIDDPAVLVRTLAAVHRDCEGAIELLWETPSVRNRFEDTGVVTSDVARELGLVGPAARASGLVRDVRRDHPSGWFRDASVPLALLDSGDVMARAMVRWLECRHAVAFCHAQLVNLPDGPVRTELGPLAPRTMTVTLGEGWRGEVAHVVATGDRGELASYRVVDPSFHNWTGLAMALRDQAISDFPLCNKSFNLSYCGHDL